MLYLFRHLSSNEPMTIDDMILFLQLVRQGGYERILLQDATLYHSDGTSDTMRSHISVEVYAE